MINEQAWDLRKALEAKRHMIPKYQEEAIAYYKAFAGFRRGLEI